MTLPHKETKVWRYMSFSRFVWLLQKKQLWLSRADLLGDPWEISLAGDQLKHVISLHPIQTGFIEKRAETAMERAERIIKLWRQKTFINCWSGATHESHALWRIYCPNSDGVAIQTTLNKLKSSVGDLPVYEIDYATPGAKKQTPTHRDLVTKKRHMFAYEQEFRIVNYLKENNPIPAQNGHELSWNPSNFVESIFVHPEADNSFMETVSTVVESYAPKLKKQIEWSAMKPPPPV